MRHTCGGPNKLELTAAHGLCYHSYRSYRSYRRSYRSVTGTPARQCTLNPSTVQAIPLPVGFRSVHRTSPAPHGAYGLRRTKRNRIHRRSLLIERLTAGTTRCGSWASGSKSPSSSRGSPSHATQRASTGQPAKLTNTNPVGAKRLCLFLL